MFVSWLRELFDGWADVVLAVGVTRKAIYCWLDIPWNWPKFMGDCWAKEPCGMPSICMYILANCRSCCLFLSASSLSSFFLAFFLHLQSFCLQFDYFGNTSSWMSHSLRLQSWSMVFFMWSYNCPFYFQR